jgi:hypothetical protein
MPPSTNTHTYLAWRREPTRATTLRLHTNDPDHADPGRTGPVRPVVDRPVADLAVPDPVAALLLRAPLRLLTEDPAHDLLLAEQDLRGEVRRAARELAEAAEDITLASEADSKISEGIGSWVHRWKRRAASAYLAEAGTTHTVCSQRHEAALAALAALREFVIGLELAGGPLARAAAGWQRDPAPPDYVVVFDNEKAFLAGDARRGVRAWWGGIEPGGLDFGLEWRRDPDDATPDALTPHESSPVDGLVRFGAWRLSYLPRLREVYATRRAPGHPEQVWLLGTGLSDETAVTSLLTELETDMLAPNSLILAADVIHQYARTAQASDPATETGSRP